MAQRTILRSYARRDLDNPAEALPNSILFAHTGTTLTIYDAYPKSTFHFLVLPRLKAVATSQDGDKKEKEKEIVDAMGLGLKEGDLKSLKRLLRKGKEKARKILEPMQEAAQACVKEIEEEMIRMYGFKWDIWIGFHPVPSMEHLHLHIISADLCSTALKNKKHYNSFHPKHGFFLDLSEVLEWLDAEQTFFEMKAQLNPAEYEPFLKEDLVCFKCHKLFKNIPKLKEHLQEEFDALIKREKAKQERLAKQKRKREEKERNEREGSASTATSVAASTPKDAEDIEAVPEKKRKG
ncbi:hypothetical protein EIP91_009448 [Steccherinum ochraceum]|uniref:Aprataxin C2HE/C2H2/C2HC zinc finger domain-containing protein n=1 Tax=Steccherinum ochraceum TaxID=92696 RepID=A0A4R0RXL6_9APHY|nr:hypothetical protein EIP91_009448 [Steccherinum ochraceum]